MVPMLRTCTSPMCRRRLAPAAGTCRASAASFRPRDASSSRRCAARRPLRGCSSGPGTRPRSTRCSGAASRSFIIGIRLMPPASILRAPSASSAERFLQRRRARVFECLRNHAWPPCWISFQIFSGVSGISMCRTPKRRQRVHHRVHHRRRAADGAGFAHAFHAQRIHRRRRHPCGCSRSTASCAPCGIA